ncbi:hypothetical protein CPJCM30710_27820 [Clostridium polyendosporum]|uniref:Bro-N domain-containing protein n=1 Tax=Clostridium polyendosporum TaxID=69208 RepID=A0A919S2F3_9CLOT|nr:BRO family protein [Clostridium polyendosporum]GIM30116.1 hypothetical protein CPJCM30710_27820 [Clostridium polyendosporum]
MNNLQAFNSSEFGQVRVVMVGEKPYAVASDVARALGYSNPRDAISRHCRYVVKHDTVTTQGNKTSIAIIPEGDIYRLIVKSKLSAAVKFESWVFDEVLPSIRKTGGYVNNEDLFIKTYLPNADEATKGLFKVTLESVRNLNKQIEVMKPIVEYCEKVIAPGKLVRTRTIAKDLGFRSDRGLYEVLKETKVIYKKDGVYQPYANYAFLVTDGYADYTINKYGQTFKWTEKGRKWLINFLKMKGVISPTTLTKVVLSQKDLSEYYRLIWDSLSLN